MYGIKTRDIVKILKIKTFACQDFGDQDLQDFGDQDEDACQDFGDQVGYKDQDFVKILEIKTLFVALRRGF